MMVTIATAAIPVLILSTFVYLRPKHYKKPPGPKPLPLIGNLLDFPVQNAWLTYAKWREQYGDIVYMNIFGTPIVVLNSLEACTALFDKRSAKYSSRPRLVMMCELMGWNTNFGLMPYSSRWRRHRRLFHQHFNENMSLNHRSVQQRGTHAFLQRLLTQPEQLFDHLRLLFGATITEVTYGIKIKGPNDSLLKMAEATAQTAMSAGVPGQFMVDVFPALKYLPTWSPGSAFQRQAATWKNMYQELRDMLFAQTKDKINKGTASPSIVSGMLSKCDDERNTLQEETLEEAIKGCASTAYLAGADTSLSSIQAFFMAMANHPNVQKAAQIELDTLLGGSRLPNFDDAQDLPFVSAIIKELLRWHNTAPLAVAHCLTEDDEYNGYLLPKGTILFGNTWLILHNPKVYADPLKFNPWRWTLDTSEGTKLNDALPDPALAAFGYGRRVCPGRHFASNALFITIACVLTCFDILPLDSKGQPAEQVEEAFTSGLVSYPSPFNVSITPRSDRISQLLKDLEL